MRASREHQESRQVLGTLKELGTCPGQDGQQRNWRGFLVHLTGELENSQASTQNGVELLVVVLMLVVVLILLFIAKNIY